MIRIIPRNSAGIADTPKFFFNAHAAVKYLEKNLGSDEMTSVEVLTDVGDVHYVIHSTLHPDQYDYKGKDPQEIIENHGHVIPASNHGMAMRDVEGLKRRTGRDQVHQVLIIGPGAKEGAEVHYLHS